MHLSDQCTTVVCNIIFLTYCVCDVTDDVEWPVQIADTAALTVVQASK